MDPNNPHSQPQGYFTLVNFPYDGFTPNVNIGTSLIPSFSTQQSHAPPQSQDTAQIPSFTPQLHHGPSQSEDTQRETAHDNKERRKWSSADDLVQVSGWLNTSKDPIVGNDQRGGTFWQRIAAYYMSSDHVLKHGGEGRTIDNCKQRWGRLSRDVSHFCGQYAHAVAEKASGMNDVDVLNTAHELYTKIYKKKFTLEHAWRVLRFEAKWCSLALMNPTSNNSSKKRKGDDSAPSVGSTVGEEESRPPGIKAMKAKRSKGKAGPAADYQQMWENKQKDMEAKTQLQRMSLLDTLIAKTQPLDEEGKLLKKKLMADLI